MEKVTILPQYIFKFKSDRHLLDDTLKKVNFLEWEKNEVNLITKNTQLNQEKQFENLHQWFYKCLKEVCNELKYECSDIIITQSWANKSEPRMWHHGHTHPNSFISGIFYVTDSNAKTWFSVPNLWNLNKDSMLRVLCEETEIIHKQPSQAGTLVLFPSTLFHSVDDLGKYNRYTISFNTLPSGFIGDLNKSAGADIKITITNNQQQTTP